MNILAVGKLYEPFFPLDLTPNYLFAWFLYRFACQFLGRNNKSEFSVKCLFIDAELNELLLCTAPQHGFCSTGGLFLWHIPCIFQHVCFECAERTGKIPQKLTTNTAVNCIEANAFKLFRTNLEFTQCNWFCLLFALFGTSGEKKNPTTIKYANEFDRLVFLLRPRQILRFSLSLPLRLVLPILLCRSGEIVTK